MCDFGGHASKVHGVVVIRWICVLDFHDICVAVHYSFMYCV
jgi:hypothetical protein